MKQVDEAIFLHRIPFSETSAIVSYFTKEHGYQKFMFPGARKKNQPFFALNIQQITYYKRPDSEMGKMTAAETLGLIHSIPFHPLRSAIAYFIAEVCQKCLNHTEKDHELFAFLTKSTIQLDTLQDLSYFPHLFLLGLTQHLGIQPQMETNAPQSFDLVNGVFTTISMKERSLGGEPMHFIFDLLENRKREVDRMVRRQALEGLLDYYKYHIEHFGNLKSKEVIDELFAE